MMAEMKSIFDSNDLDSIDAQINNEMSRGTLIDQMQETSEKREARKMDWMGEIKEYWYIYLLVFVSGLFTLTLGVYMGLDPRRMTDPATGAQYIYWNTDWGHVIMAVILGFAFLAVTEFVFVIGKLRHQTREEGNTTQRWTSWLVMAIGALSVLVTGVAGFRVVLSNVAMMTEFQEIPRSAQLWVSIAIPTLITIHLVLLTSYANSSAHAKAKRLARENKRKQDMDQETRMAFVEQMANRAFQVQEIRAFERAVMAGLLTATEAAAARRAGKTLQQLEKELGRDLNQDGRVERGDSVPVPALTGGKNGRGINP
jgi:TRAP-type C4-dicarboxylate transport system permease small subunit